MTKLSPLQQERLKYQPKLPQSLSMGINSLEMIEGEATQSVRDQDQIKALFSNTYGKPVVTFKNSGSSSIGVLITQCNGVTIPDLTDRFIVQAGGNYAEGTTGGANTVTLSVNQMPSHDHGGNTSEDGAHQHYSDFNTYKNASEGSSTNYTRNRFARANGDHEIQRVSSNNTGSHSHSISAQGGGQAHENRPPFYALCYLIKVI